MPNQTLTKIHDKPVHKAVRKLEKELGDNLVAVECPWGHRKGHLGKLQDAATFLARNGAAYTPSAHAPPPYPNIPTGTTTAERKHLEAENETALGHWQTLQHVRHIVVNQVDEATEPVYYTELDDPMKDSMMCLSVTFSITSATVIVTSVRTRSTETWNLPQGD
jgi:hypothetical protein